MGIRQSFPLGDTSTTAGFKSWANDIGAAFIAAGWVQTADQNQINWNTWTLPGNNNNITAGFEIYKSTDALSATCPIYVKVQYSTAAYTTSPNNSPQVYFSVGFGTDGYGNLTTFSSPVMGSNGGTRPALSTSVRVVCDYSWYGSGSNIAMVLFGRVGNHTPTFFCVERSHDANGNDTDEYITYVYYNQNYAVSQSYLKPTAIGVYGGVHGGGYGPWVTGCGPYILPDGNASGGNSPYGVAFSPLFPLIGRVGNPLRSVAAFKSADVGDNELVQCQLYGQTQYYQTFRAVGLTCNLPGGWNQQNNSNNNYATLGLRWDAGA